MYKSGIYLWVNKITGKVYIGQANDLDRRRKDFYNFNRHYGGIYIDRARIKYNIPEIWEYKVLAYCPLDSLNLLERTFITHFKDNNYSLYNMTTGGSREYQLLPEVVTEMKKKCRVNSDSNKEVIQMDLNGNTIAEYRSTREAEEHTKINHVSISLACRGKNGTSGHRSHRFLWYYKK
jgi:hypothetical protein